MPVNARLASTVTSESDSNSIPVQFIKLNGTGIHDCTEIGLKVNFNAVKPRDISQRTSDEIKTEIKAGNFQVRVYGYRVGKRDTAQNPNLIARSNVILPFENNDYRHKEAPEQAEGMGCLPEASEQPPVCTGEFVCSMEKFNLYGKDAGKIVFDIDIPPLSLQKKHAGFSIKLNLADAETLKDFGLERYFEAVPSSLKFHTVMH